MTTQERKALKLALEALYDSVSDNPEWIAKRERTVAALRAALEQPAHQEPTNIERHERNVQKFLGASQPKEPEQEPVAWIYRTTGALFDICPNDADVGEFLPLYTTPPQRTWVGLTDEEISEIAINNPPMVHEFARAIEAKLKEKNT